MSEVNIALFNADGLELDFDKSDPDLSGEGVIFVRASVKSGTWILYNSPEYNKKPEQAKPDDIQIVYAGDEVDLKFNPGSLYSVVSTRETAIVFEHSNYCGGHFAFDNHGCPDVTALFPPGEVGGASSLIINPDKKWQLFTGTKYTGLHKDESPGWYPDPQAMKFPNDSLRSIRPR